MPITIYPGTVKKRNLNGTYSDLVPGADANPQLANDIAEEYDPVAGVYSVGDYCIYQSVLYKCITAILTPEAFDSTKWADVSVTDEISGVKNTLNQLDADKAAKVDLVGNIILSGVNTTGQTITKGTYFYNNGSLVRAIAAISGSPAGTITAQNTETVTAGGLNDLQKVEHITVSSTYGVTAVKCGNIVSVFVKYDNGTGFPDSGSDIMLPVGWRPSVNIRQKNYTGNFAVQVAAAGDIAVASGLQDSWINVSFTYIV